MLPDDIGLILTEKQVLILFDKYVAPRTKEQIEQDIKDGGIEVFNLIKEAHHNLFEA